MAEIASWHLTWQDPVALVLAAAGLALVWWLRRRATARRNIKKVPVEGLSLSKRRPPPVTRGPKPPDR